MEKRAKDGPSGSAPARSDQHELKIYDGHARVWHFSQSVTGSDGSHPLNKQKTAQDNVNSCSFGPQEEHALR